MTETNTLYLGRYVDDENRLTPRNATYPLDHLTTHALLLGATGSGKTGMGLVLIEEALRQNVPVLLLDVKGDLVNLLLTFPDLAPADFAPWVDADIARRKGQSPEQVATAAAEQWRAGLAQWDLGPQHISDLRRRSAMSIITPGSHAGTPVDILARFGAPPSTDPDEVILRAQGLTSALLGLAGVEADPLRSREHILLTTLIQHTWAERGTLDVPTLIQQVQQPPMERVGVFDIESFFPQKERFELALLLNNLVAAPGFQRWREGEALDIENYLYTADGRPRATVFYLAHLPVEQQHFFVTLFLEELRSWARQQSGTRTLRALLYFDEIYGYLPPHPHNPPTKAPLMALVKQGRAVGLGIVLATQNPGDLDYKGLGNIGTWFVGTLRTERDQKRVLEGMEGAIADAGMRINDVETALSRLKSRIFLAYNARAGSLHFFHSRWSMSYLHGPLTSAEIKKLSGTETQAQPDAALTFGAPATTQPPAEARAATTIVTTPAPRTSQDTQRLTSPPSVDPAIPQTFLPPTITDAWARRNHPTPLPESSAARLVYKAHLLGVAIAHIFDERTAVSLSDDQVWRVAPADANWTPRWDQGEMLNLNPDDLSHKPPAEGFFDALPRGMGAKSAYAKFESALKTHVYRHSQITIWSCPMLKLYSKAEENKRAFFDRCRREMEKRKKAEIATARQKLTRKADQLKKKIRREEIDLGQEEDELAERKREELLSGAESVLNLFSRRRRSSRALSQTSRQRRYVQKAQADVGEAYENLKMYTAELEELEESWSHQERSIAQKWNAALEQIREVVVRAKRADIEIRFCGLAWFPFWEIATEDDDHRLLPAYMPL